MRQRFGHWLQRFKERTSERATRKQAGTPVTTPDAKRRRRRWRIAIAALLVLLAYPVLGTLALWTGFVEWLAKSEDLRVEIANPSYTIWPGHFHLKHVRILVNGDTQFTLEGSDLVAHVSIFPLVKRTLRVTKLSADDVRYRMRLQVKDSQGENARIRAYPPLKDLPGVNTVHEKTAQKTEERGKPWTVNVDGIDIRVAELWFLEYRYVGDGTLRGGFIIGDDFMEVGTSVQDLGPGDLRFGPDQVILSNFRGRIEAAIPRLKPSEHADESFLDFVTARVAMKGDVQTLAHLGAYAAGLKFSDGKGPLDVDVRLEKGWLGPNSRLNYDTDVLRLFGDGFGVATDWKLGFEMVPAKQAQDGRPVPRVRSNAKASYVTLAGNGKEHFTIHVLGHSQSATLKSSQIGSSMALKHAHLDFPKIVSGDLDDLNALADADSALKTERGSARAAMKFDVDENYVLKGPITANVNKSRFELAGVQLGGDAKFRSDVWMNLKQKHVALNDVNLSLADVLMHVGDEHVENWWLNLSSKRMEAWLPAKKYEATILVRAKDTEPILESLAEKDKLNDLVAKFTSLDDLRLSLTVRGAGDATDIMVRSMESDVWDASGRIYSKGEQTRTALVIGGKTVSVGIASDGKSTEIKPLAGEDWLNERLRSFPKPIEQVAGEKP